MSVEPVVSVVTVVGVVPVAGLVFGFNVLDVHSFSSMFSYLYVLCFVSADICTTKFPSRELHIFLHGIVSFYFSISSMGCWIHIMDICILFMEFLQLRIPMFS